MRLALKGKNATYVACYNIGNGEVKEEMITKKGLKEALLKTGYVADQKTLDAVWVALLGKRPLILEGPAGCGKTSLGKALADGFDLSYSRVQMYEGLTDDRILYDYDYQKMLIVAEMMKDRIQGQYKNFEINDAIEKMSSEVNFYSKGFLLPRPILSSITGNRRTVLCIDELDKASEETEYMLYEFLENYSITIPQYGTIRCPEGMEPIVFITSNGYRELSGALRRRCGYLYIPEKTKSELAEILMSRVSVSKDLAESVADCFMKLRKAPLRKQPSVSEAIDLTAYLAESSNEEITKKYVMSGLSLICKSSRDEVEMSNALSEFADDYVMLAHQNSLTE